MVEGRDKRTKRKWGQNKGENPAIKRKKL